MKELLEKLAQMEPERFALNNCGDAWGFTVRQGPEVEGYHIIVYRNEVDLEYAWLLTGMLLEKMPRPAIEDWGQPFGDDRILLRVGGVVYDGANYHEAVLRAYIAWKEADMSSAPPVS